MGIKIAIIGSGPAAFYTAQSLLKEDIEYEIDIIEKLFSPYGLVRYGVSPDHQSTKNVSRVFERTLSNTNVEFFGGIAIALGLLTRLAALGIIIVMCVGIWVAYLDNGYFPTYDTYGYQLCLVGLAYSLLFVGGGRYSLDKKFF